MPRRRNVNQRMQQRAGAPPEEAAASKVDEGEAHDEQQEGEPSERQHAPEHDVEGADAEDGAAATPDAPGAPETKARPPLQVLYCEVCSFPPEYCEFGTHPTRCKSWLEGAHPDLYERYYSQDALTSKAGALTPAAAQKLEQDAKKKEAKAEAKAESEAKKRKAAKVTIKRIERNKRKHITAIHGLEAFGVDLRAAAKVMARAFATGASVARNAAGQDEIVVQGDVSQEVEEMLERGGGALGGGIGGKTGEGEVVRQEVKGKKGE